MGDVSPAGGTPDAPGSVDAPLVNVDAPSADALLRQWSGCMTLTNFQTANMAVAWGTLNTATNQECSNCHALGGQGFIASTDEAVFFKTVTEQSAYLVKYFSADAASGTVIINNVSMMSAGVSLTDHPHFDPINNAGMRALATFFDSTKALKAAGTCDPPRLVN